MSWNNVLSHISRFFAFRVSKLGSFKNNGAIYIKQNFAYLNLSLID